ncbi:hypothetical protein CEE69_13855 [Rhodopirellula bahusiensis]|uniref:Uncharacterized protein n=1 Tax=Rhodopirellula bahusiensis TaxID=2014065 RepID=A0A2G1W7E0_9BACT|nr:hypothetical protein CEE69_13855 [Rhodopirellula bahusiensis]
MHSPVNRFANSIRTACSSLTRFEVAFFPRIANGPVQFKTFGLMLAVGQPICLRSRSLGRCPRLR